MKDGLTPRELLETTVAARARHDTRDKVGDTRSFANMEQTLTREYWGRFLIELLQNARDAWLLGPSQSSEGLLRIRLTSDPALVVCNEGQPLTPDVVLHSISKFGESPKKYGEGIGHKGIGFKAVLELTHSPRLYSRTEAAGPFDLQVRFDPDEAKRLILEHSPDWDRLVAELPSAAVDDARGDRIPILRFPLWEASPPDWLDEAAQSDGRGFNTIISLPYDSRFDASLELSREDFIGRAKRAFSDVSDEVVLLLGVFGRIVIEDEIAGSTQEIVRTERTLVSPVPDMTLHDISVVRDGQLTSRWWMFERSLPGFTGLEGDLSVAVRLDEDLDGRLVPVAPRNELRDESSADCFHLFFPTRIRTHLPFLFHAYFEVDAGRKSFAEDRAKENEVRLAGLRVLAVDATRHLVAAAIGGDLNLVGLPSLFALTKGEPDDTLARTFRDDLLRDLDAEPWVATNASPDAFTSPGRLLVDDRGDLPMLLPIAFPAAYVRRRLGRDYPRTNDPDALAFLAARNAVARNVDGEGLDGDTVRALLRPGPDPIWDSDPDSGFRALLEVLDVTKRDPDVAGALDEIRADTAATFIPVVDESGSRRLRAPGRRQADTDADDPDILGAILARVSATGDTPLAPPRSLGLDFVADGLLDAERLAGVGARLGIRPYQTEVIIDALAARPDDPDSGPDILGFAWRLLLRERGRYSLVNVMRTATTFDPGKWFWSKADGNRSDSDREELRRARALANLRVPTAAGSWRAATEVAFGAEWAEWLDARADRLGATASIRADAYRDLQAIAPGLDSLVAAPAVFVGALPLIEDDIGWARSETGPELPEDPVERHVVLLHALLLRLGVWEVPPVRGYVNYRHPRVDDAPPWATDPAWSKLRQAHEGLDADFARYGHKNVHVAEDFAFAWTPIASETFVRALGRGAATYRGYRRAELFCPQCSPGGNRWHTKRHSTDNEARFQSFLQRQLTREPWVPTTVWGTTSTPTRPRDAWFEDDRPEEARMQQSWMRFLPLATTGLSGDLAALAGVRRLKDADVPRIGRLLKVLRERFEADEVDPERRAGSFASQAFIGLHWRLYDQLAARDPAAGRAVLDEVGVLAKLGRSLVYRPPSECRQDDASFSAFLRYFVGQLPFVVLTRDQGPVADALAIERFHVGVERIQGGEETVVTGDVRRFVHDRAAEYLALQMFHPIGARALQLDGREFPVRSERLRRLEVVRVDDLVLRLTVDGTDLTKEVGAGRGEDLYLATDETPVRLYHDIAGARWEDRFRALAGPYLAALLENPAYAATFQLLLQAESEADVEAFLEERSISSEDVELIRTHMEAVAGVVRTEERRWWSVLLSILGADVATLTDGEAFRTETLVRLRTVTHDSPVPDLALRLFRAGGGESSRHDGSPEGALAAMEAHGIDLRTFNELLVEAGDSGIRIQVSAQRLSDWRRAHGRAVAAILAKRLDVDIAKAMPDAWASPPDLAFTINSSPSEYLAPVIADLRLAGVELDPDRLVGPGASEYLAGLVGETEDGLATLWHSLFDEDERARLGRDRAQAWKRALRPALVAARTRPGDGTHVIRADGASVDAALPASPDDASELAASLPGVLTDNDALAEMLGGLLRDDRSLSDPTVAGIRDDLGPFLDLDHFDRVVIVLQRGRRQIVDQVRQDIEDVRERHLVPTPFAGAEPPSRRPPPDGQRKSTVRPRRAHDQRVRDRLGAKGERVALAAVLDALLTRPRDEQDRVIESLVELLESVATGGIVDRMVADARSAQSASDDDDRLEALANFLHVAQVSDDFGFDLLGYLAPFAGTEPRPLLLEVKNSANRSFIASVPEWRRAQEQGDRYAFFVVVRDPSSEAPAALELIPDPSELFRLGQISRDEESWSIAYKLLDAT